MDPLTVSTEIEAPPERVFSYLEDVANHAQFWDHFLVDWHLLRENSVGLGAGARFRIKAPLNRFSWGDMTIAELDPPRRIVEVGRTGKANRIRAVVTYELTQIGPQGTRVELTVETEAEVLFDRIQQSLGQRMRLRLKNGRALRRLRSIIEEGKGAGERVTVAAR